MKMKRFITAALAVIALSLMENSCDVHEFPNPDLEHKVVLEMDFDRELPEYQPKEEVKTKAGQASKLSPDPDDYTLRHTLQIYKADSKGGYDKEKVFRMFTFTSDDIKCGEETFEFTLPVGNFKFIIWSDHVVEEGKDHFYHTKNFNVISFMDGRVVYTDPKYAHVGCNDLKDAFKGTTDCSIRSGITNVIPIAMDRPFAKFTFVSTDLEEFITKVETLGGNKAVNLKDYTIVFRYDGFVNTEYNLHTMRTAYSTTGITFTTTMDQLDSQNVELGFDYAFVNDSEGLVVVIVETYDAAGQKISQTQKIQVRLMRGHHTIVKGKFLTTMSSGGVGIYPDFDGSFDIPIID